MKEISYSEVRQNLSEILNEVCANKMPICITRRNGDKAVIVSADEYEAMDETAYLMRTKANIKYLKQSIQQADNKELFSIDELDK